VLLKCLLLLLLLPLFHTVYLLATDDSGEQRHAARVNRSSSDASSHRDSVDSTLSISEFDDSGMGDNSMVSTGDTSFSGADGQSPSEDQAGGGDMSSYTVPVSAATKDRVRLKCREMLSAALKTPREFFSRCSNGKIGTFLGIQ